MYKRYLFILSSFIIFCLSCSNKELYLFDEDVKELQELLEWSVNNNTDDLGLKYYRPLSSETLSDMASLDENVSSIEHNKGDIIGALYFNENEAFLNKNQKDLLFLIAKTQIVEDFNILIESNNIKTIMPGIIEKITDSLLFNGVKSNHISLNYLSGSNKKLIIKFIKLL